MSYENKNKTKTDWLKVSTVMMEFLTMGLILTIGFTAVIVLNAQYEAVRGDLPPFVQLVIFNVVTWGFVGAVAAFHSQRLLSHE